ncbi:MAG: sulfite oxidase-like oxidoreductase [Nitrososphaerales archaeon]
MSTLKKVPPNQRFALRWAIYAALGVPEIKLEDWRLKVTGLVENPLSFSYVELIQSPLMVKLVRDFHCVTGWSIANVNWEGIPIKALADKARVKPETKWVMFYCADGYTTPIPLEDALVEDSLIVFKMNGKPLSIEQGFPARPFIPHLYGWKSAKWLTEIEFLKDYVDGYWEMYGYHERGNVWDEERFKGREGKHKARRGLGTKALW